MEVAADRSARRLRPGRLGLAIGVVGLLLMAALGTVGWLVVDLTNASDREQGRAEALRVARQFTVNFTTIDHRTVDRDIGRVRKLASGDFGQEYENAVDSVRDVVKENRTASTGEVLEAGLVDFDGDDARALVVADSKLKNVALDQREQRHYRLQLDLAREGETWRVIDVVFVQ